MVGNFESIVLVSMSAILLRLVYVGIKTDRVRVRFFLYEKNEYPITYWAVVIFQSLLAISLLLVWLWCFSGPIRQQVIGG